MKPSNWFRVAAAFCIPTSNLREFRVFGTFSSLGMATLILFYFIFIFKGFCLFIFRQREREGKRKGEKYQCVVASCMLPTEDLACNPGLCPDWESNWQPFGSQASAQSTEPHQSRPHFLISTIS